MPGDLFLLDSVALLVTAAVAGVLAVAALAALAATSGRGRGVVVAGVAPTGLAHGRPRAADSFVPLPAEAGATPGCVRHAGGQLQGARKVQEDDHGFIDGPTLDPAWSAPGGDRGGRHGRPR